MRMHKIFWGGHLLGNNSRVARRHRCADVGRPLPARGSRHAFRFATAPRAVAAGAAFALVLLAGALLFPTTPDAVHAEETGSTATLAIDPSIAISIPGEISFAVTPTATGEFASGSATLSVSTNNSSGYALYLSAPDGNALKSLNPDTSATVAALSQPATSDSDDFANNTWGYNLGTTAPDDSATYQAVPLDQSQPQQTTEAPTNDTYTLTFGAKVDNTMPSGTYTSTVTISVVANPAYVPNLTQISNMQDMTTEICNASTVGQTNRLTDTRDGKLYWVAKLADNQCWMTQNLDLDLDSSKPLTSADSDISESRGSWTPTDTQNNTMGFSDYYGTQSFDPGMYVNNDPMAITSCDNYWSGGSCSNWTDVSSMTAMTEERTDGTIIDGNTYDAHYLAGNYYQWNAATAGTGGSDVTIQYQDATDSICPKGWRLPSSGDSDDTNDFYGLTTGTDATMGEILAEAPYYFIPAGWVNSGSLNDAGYVGGHWSSTADSSTDAYSLGFDFMNVNPSMRSNRGSGWSVRCLAR